MSTDALTDEDLAMADSGDPPELPELRRGEPIPWQWFAAAAGVLPLWPEDDWPLIGQFWDQQDAATILQTFIAEAFIAHGAQITVTSREDNA